MTLVEARAKGFEIPTEHPKRRKLNRTTPSGERLCDNCTMAFHPGGQCNGCQACTVKIDGFLPGALTLEEEAKVEEHIRDCPSQFEDKCLRCLHPGHSAYACEVLFCGFCWRKWRKQYMHVISPTKPLPWVHITDIAKCFPELQWGPQAGPVGGRALVQGPPTSHGSQHPRQQSARRHKIYAGADKKGKQGSPGQTQ